MPLTIEPLHQFERSALTALGANNPAALRAAGVDPRATAFLDRAGGMLDRFGDYSSEAAGMNRAGTQGFNQAEFDQYYNPHTEMVRDRTLTRLSDEAEKMRANLLRMTASNRGNASFGDLYGAQRMGDIDKEYLQKSGDIIATGNQAGFDTALEALFKQRSNQLQGGQNMAGIGGQYINAAGTAGNMATGAQNIAGAGYEQGVSGINNQLTAGNYIRGFNQNSANQAFTNLVEPTRFSNAVTTAAVSGTPGVQGSGASYTVPYYDRFSNVAQGVGGALSAASQIKF
jgi:hypothetical protein